MAVAVKDRRPPPRTKPHDRCRRLCDAAFLLGASPDEYAAEWTANYRHRAELLDHERRHAVAYHERTLLASLPGPTVHLLALAWLREAAGFAGYWYGEEYTRLWDKYGWQFLDAVGPDGALPDRAADSRLTELWDEYRAAYGNTQGEPGAYEREGYPVWRAWMYTQFGATPNIALHHATRALSLVHRTAEGRGDNRPWAAAAGEFGKLAGAILERVWAVEDWRGEWQTGDAAALARAYEDTYDAGAKLALADALLDAGMPEDHAVQGTLRGGARLDRGAWVLDKLAGRAG